MMFDLHEEEMTKEDLWALVGKLSFQLERSQRDFEESRREYLEASNKLTETERRLADQINDWGRVLNVGARWKERAEAAEGVLRQIQGWDMLNPPQTDRVGDLGWLRKLVDDALAVPQSSVGELPKTETQTNNSEGGK